MCPTVSAWRAAVASRHPVQRLLIDPGAKMVGTRLGFGIGCTADNVAIDERLHRPAIPSSNGFGAAAIRGQFGIVLTIDECRVGVTAGHMQPGIGGAGADHSRL